MSDPSMGEKNNCCSDCGNNFFDTNLSHASSQSCSSSSKTHSNGEILDSSHRDFNGIQPYHCKEEESLGDETKRSGFEDQLPVARSSQQEAYQSLPQPIVEHQNTSFTSEADHFKTNGEMRHSMMPICICSQAPVGNSCAHVGTSREMEEHSNCYSGAHVSNTGIPLLPKNIINLTRSVMYPPDPSQRKTLSERPPGCKTVFVGGLPEKITMETIREVFERCGKISDIEMSNQDYCHIRFTEECHVDNAICLSGYEIKIENRDDATHRSKLFVNFAVRRNDHNEYLGRQRQDQRQGAIEEVGQQINILITKSL